jgi:flagellar assembly protein FliH
MQRRLAAGAGGDVLFPLAGPDGGGHGVASSPLEYRSLEEDEVELVPVARKDGDGAAVGREAGAPGAQDVAAREAAEAARRDGQLAGEREGRRAMQAQMEAEMQASVARERQRVQGVVEEFAAARDRYFSDVEQEVVKLALAIAERVLHREAQMDPLLLSAAVRVALEKMADRSGVVLRACPAEVAGWERMFRTTSAADRPIAIADERLQAGECILETKLGTVELGVRQQLEEIERGFFDLLNHRPAR